MLINMNIHKLIQLGGIVSVGLAATMFSGCKTMKTPEGSITQADFGKTADGQSVEIYTLRNSKGAEARIMTYGGIVQSLSMPDKQGKLADVVLG